MHTYHDFWDALADWRQMGGALNYQQPGPCADASWELWCSSAGLEAAIECSPREATIIALREGGLTEREIEAEMHDFVD